MKIVINYPYFMSTGLPAKTTSGKLFAMSMSFFRSKRNSVITMAVFGVIILSFLFWGGKHESSGPTGALVKVNGEEIPMRQFQRRMAQEMQTFSQFMGGQKLGEEITQLIERKVATSLIMRRLLVQQAHKMGIEIGKDEILDALKKETAFQDPKLKRFSPIVYQSVLQANELDPNEFEKDLADDLAAERLRGILEQTITASEPEVQDHARLQSTVFDLKILTFDPTKEKDLKISQADLQAYYDAHKSELLSLEKRKFKVATLDLSKLQKISGPTNLELKSFYEAELKKTSDSAIKPEESAHALHILISDATDKGLARAKEVLKSIRTESDFKSAAQRYSEDYSNSENGGDLGYFGKTSMVKPFSDAVFTKAQIGRPFGPVKTDYGYHLIWLLDKTSAATDFKNREKQTEYLYTKNKVETQAKGILEDIKKAVASGDKAVNEVLAQKGFVLSETQPIDRKAVIAAIPPLLLQQGFKAPKDQWQEPQEAGKKIVVTKVTEILPPAPLTFVEAKDSILKRVESEKLETYVKNLYAELVAKRKTAAQAEKEASTKQNLKSVKVYAAELPEPLGKSEVLTKAVQDLSSASQISAPLLHEGKWLILISENWKDLGQPSKTDLDKAEQELLSRKRAAFFDTYSTRLMKEAKIPADFKKRYNI